MFLDEPEQHRKQDDDRDDDGLECVTEESRYERSHEQDQNQDVLELRGEGAPRGRTVSRLQLVRPVDVEALRRLSARKTRQLGGQAFDHLVDRQGMPDRGVLGFARLPGRRRRR